MKSQCCFSSSICASLARASSSLLSVSSSSSRSHSFSSYRNKNILFLVRVSSSLLSVSFSSSRSHSFSSYKNKNILFLHGVGVLQPPLRVLQFLSQPLVRILQENKIILFLVWVSSSHLSVTSSHSFLLYRNKNILFLVRVSSSLLSVSSNYLHPPHLQPLITCILLISSL